VKINSRTLEASAGIVMGFSNNRYN